MNWYTAVSKSCILNRNENRREILTSFSCFNTKNEELAKNRIIIMMRNLYRSKLGRKLQYKKYENIKSKLF